MAAPVLVVAADAAAAHLLRAVAVHVGGRSEEVGLGALAVAAVPEVARPDTDRNRQTHRSHPPVAGVGVVAADRGAVPGIVVPVVVFVPEARV